MSDQGEAAADQKTAQGRGKLLRRVVAVSAGGLALVVVAVGVFFTMISRGTGGVDDWVLRQVTLILNSYLVPEIHFERSAFEWPGTLRLSGVRLTAPTGEDVIHAGEFVVILAERPRIGQPIALSNIELHDAAIRLLRDVETGGFKGLLPLVHTQTIRDQESVPEEIRLSRVMRIEQIVIQNGSIEYDDGTGAPPMQLDAIELTLDVERESPSDSAGAVWHRLDFLLDRPPFFTLSMDGAMSLDTFSAKLDRLDLRMQVGETTYGSLPPAIQTLLREHEATGDLRVLLSGEAGLATLMQSRLQGTIAIEEFNVAAGGYRLPIDQGIADLSVEEGVARLSPVQINLLGGTIKSSVEAVLADASMPITASWDAEKLELRTLMRTQTAENEKTLAGLVVSSGIVRANIIDLPASVDGKGELTIAEARLLALPVLDQVAQVMDSLGSIFSSGSRNASVDSEFRLTEKGIEFDRLRFTNPVAAIEADGLVTYDQRLDMTASGGPIQKIGGAFGLLGRIVTKVTGQLVKYRIRGTVSKPEVAVRPLGIGS